MVEFYKKAKMEDITQIKSETRHNVPVITGAVPTVKFGFILFVVKSRYGIIFDSSSGRVVETRYMAASAARAVTTG